MARTHALRLQSALVWLLCAAPLILIFYWGFTSQLTANPVEFVLRDLGLWGLRFLCVTLAVSALNRYLKMPGLMRYRRRIGLWAFAYIAMHLTVYLGAAHEFEWREIGIDIARRPYITIGMAAFALLIPLAITSFNAVRRRMKPLSWQRLHRLVYVIAVMGVAHYFLLVKADTRSPILYGAIVAVFVAMRLLMPKRRRSAA